MEAAAQAMSELHWKLQLMSNIQPSPPQSIYTGRYLSCKGRLCNGRREQHLSELEHAPCVMCLQGQQKQLALDHFAVEIGKLK
jgi:hypothetical protein